MSKSRIAGQIAVWMVTLFLVLVCLRSGIMKMPGVPGVEFWMRDFQRWGYPGWLRLVVGLAELVSAALLLIPRLAGYGASVFAIIMVGALLTHATHNEFSRLPFNLLLLGLSLIVLLVRRPAFLKSQKKIGRPEQAASKD